MKKNLEVLQEEVSDCGVCCLASIIRYYKGDISLEVLRYNTNTSSDGTNALELINCAKRYGFNAYGKKTNNLIINQPVIAHLKLENNFFHFVVIYKIEKNYVLIMDPSYGLKKVLLEDFYKVFTGVIINLIPINRIPKYKKNNFLFFKIKEELKINKNNYIKLLIISFVIFLITMLNNFEIKILSYNKDYIYLLSIVLVLNNILMYLKNIMLINSSIRFNENIIASFLEHIFKLPLHYLKLKQKGEISTRFTEINDISNSVISFLLEFIYNILLVLFTLISLIYFSFDIFLILFFLSLFYFYINFKIYKRILNDIKVSLTQEEIYNSNILDYISNFTTIKHLNIYDYFSKNILNNLDEKNKITKIINKKVYKIDLINNLFLNFILLFVLYVIINNSYSLSNGLVIYILLNFYITNAKYIVNTYPTILIFKSYINKSNEFLSFQDNKKSPLKSFNKIIINNLYYKSINKVILNNINFSIFNKEKIFISGPSGIGKSTFVKILNNEINNYKGNVLVDGKDIKTFDLSNFVTYVSQEEKLFNDTIYNNITLGEEISKEELDNVIKLTRLDKINIIKNVGLDASIINDNSLSGGERNRIILARSLIHSKKILILDEVLKELDKGMEIEIIKDILEYYKDKTIIYISHKDVEFLFDKVLTFRKE